ncbi:peptide deformylase [Micromonospora sp. WMMD967]|uniref:peptide deformylase n=1 Tax=Micromonospora sp. WMMD967 TaxID=3016101 RepID=UPI0024169A5A|nr:peptide deformylase [Micromonospora sp. WMMD967]MDG4838281.1 peptide deformylase [Micromonospora sp. WMMD967]
MGVVPVGTPVLHAPAMRYDGDGDLLRPLADRMIRTMVVANGIGLAANQVGAPIRLFVHNLRDSAPQVLLNPVVLASAGWDSRMEGCLSLQVPGSRVEVDRPKQITVRADLLDGTRTVIEADEMLARVVQHELDHLDGLEYVQRLTGDRRDSVYRMLARAEVPLDLLPDRPYPVLS